MIRQLHLLWQAHFPSRTTRQIRYIAIAIAIVLILVQVIINPLQPTDTNDYDGARTFHIQHTFKEETTAAKRIRLNCKEHVRMAFIHSWEGYKDHAWLHDEVMPLSGGNKDPFNGWAATLVDSLDSLYILGLQKEFEHALAALASIDFSKPNAERVPIFEITIRYLG